MTRFFDGPAAGQTLLLKRSPLYLRVVSNAGGAWDGLDQVTDTPNPGETLHAYRVHSLSGMAHVNMGRRGGSGFYPIAEYRHIEDQPSQEVMRSTASWREWCAARGESPRPRA